MLLLRLLSLLFAAIAASAKGACRVTPHPANDTSLHVLYPLLGPLVWPLLVPCISGTGEGAGLALGVLPALQPSRPGLLGAEVWMMHVPMLLRSSMLSRLVMLARRCAASLLVCCAGHPPSKLGALLAPAAQSSSAAAWPKNAPRIGRGTPVPAAAVLLLARLRVEGPHELVPLTPAPATPLTAEMVEPKALLPEAPELCRTWELLPLPSVLRRPLVLPKPAVDVPAAAFAAAASAAACAARAAAAQGLASAPLELLRVALSGAAMPPLLLGLLAPSDASSLYSRESSVMVRMCLGTAGQKELCPPKPLLAGCSRRLHGRGEAHRCCRNSQPVPQPVCCWTLKAVHRGIYTTFYAEVALLQLLDYSRM
jgi:hypothetical protein